MKNLKTLQLDQVPHIDSIVSVFEIVVLLAIYFYGPRTNNVTEMMFSMGSYFISLIVILLLFVFTLIQQNPYGADNLGDVPEMSYKAFVETFNIFRIRWLVLGFRMIVFVVFPVLFPLIFIILYGIGREAILMGLFVSWFAIREFIPIAFILKVAADPRTTKLQFFLLAMILSIPVFFDRGLISYIRPTDTLRFVSLLPYLYIWILPVFNTVVKRPKNI